MNLLEFAFGLNPTLASSLQTPQGQHVGANFVISFLTPSGVSGITYGAESSTTLEADGKILVGGDFTQFSGVPRTALARLTNNEATQSLVAVSRSQITWLRGGTAPEASAVTFEVSTDGGTTWMPLAQPSASRAAGILRA